MPSASVATAGTRIWISGRVRAMGWSWMRAGVAVLLVVLLSVGLWAIQLTLEQSLQRTIVEPYDLALAELDHRLELSSNMGTHLADSSGVNRDLYRTMEIMRSLRGGSGRPDEQPSIVLAAPDGAIIDVAPIHLGEGLARAMIDEVLGSSIATRTLGDYVQRGDLDGRILSARPVYREDVLKGWLISAIPKHGLMRVSEQFSSASTESRLRVWWPAALVILSVVMTVGLSASASGRRFSVGMFLSIAVLVGTHLMFVLSVASNYQTAARDSSMHAANAVLWQAQSDLERIHQRGFAVETLKFERLAWSRTAHQLRGFTDLRVSDGRGRLLYSAALSAARAGEAELDPAERDAAMLSGLTAPVLSPDCCKSLRRSVGEGAESIHIELILKTPEPGTYLKELLRDLLSSIMVLGTLFTEAILVAAAVLARGRPASGAVVEQPEARTGTDAAACLFIRTLFFLLMLGIDLSISFIPLHMERMFDPSLGMSRGLMMGLPISAEFLFVGIALATSGFWIDR
ncbi:MAG: hypothetical protein KDK91_05045, partial [Gammaproteobacteria bacterium]|nr:hypothetical protein [Gammaproteobacteria bacterium]